MIKKLIIFLFFSAGLFFSSCRPCDPEIIDHGPLSTEERSFIPYQNDNILTLRHNSGHEIHFTCTRECSTDYLMCEECCDYKIKYQQEIIRFSPDYPIFNMEFSIDNADSSYTSYSCIIGQSGYSLPYSDDTSATNFRDSLNINGSTYYDVCCLQAISNGYYQDSIRPDSLYINKADGILRITISNGEYYEI